MPAPAFVRQATHASTSAATSHNLSMGTQPAARNGIVLKVLQTALGAAPTVSGGGCTWTRVVHIAAGFNTISVWVGIEASGSGGATITINLDASGDIVAHGTEYTFLTATLAGTPESFGDNAVLGASAVALSVNTVGSGVLNFTNCIMETVYAGDTAPTSEDSAWTDMTNVTGSTPTLVMHPRRRSTTTGTTTVYDADWGYPGGARWGAVAFGLQGRGQVAATGAAAATGGSTVSAIGSGATAPPFGLRVAVYDDGNVNTRLATLIRATGISWVDPFNAIGSGRFALALSDPLATTDILREGNLVRCYLGPFDVFRFWIDTPAYTLAAGEAGDLVVVTGRGFEAYLDRAQVWAGGASYSGVSPGAVMRGQIAAAQARGAIPLVQVDFDETRDSAGVAWSADLAQTLTLAAGTSLRAVLDQMRQSGVYAELRADFTLQMWQDPGRDLTGFVVLRQGRHVAGPVTVTQPQSQRSNAILVEGTGTHAAVIFGGTPLPDRREAYVKGPATTDLDTLIQIGVAEYARRERAAIAFQVPMHHGLGPGEVEPYRHFIKGDDIAVSIPGRYDSGDPQMVAGINVAGDDAGGYAVALDLNAVAIDPVVRLAAAVERLARPTA